MLYLKPKLNKPLLIFLKILIYFIIFTGLEKGLMVIFSRSLPEAAFILTILIIVMHRGKLTETLQKFVDKNFYYSYYRLKKNVVTLNHELTALMEYEVIVQRVRDFLDQAFDASQYSFYLYRAGNFEKVNHLPNPANPDDNVSLKLFGTDPCWQIFHQPVRIYRTEDIRKSHPTCQTIFNHHPLSSEAAFFVPLKGTKRISGFIIFSNTLQYSLQFDELRELLENLFRKIAHILENAAIHQEIKRKSLESQLLLEIVGKITSTLNLQNVLEAIVDNLSKLVEYDAAAIFLVDRERKILQQVVSRGYDKRKLELLTLKLDQGISGQVIKTHKGINIPDVSKHPNYYAARTQTKSQLTVPIISRGHAIGALVLESNKLKHFTEADLELLTFFSGLAAIAIRNAQLHEDSLKKKRLESDLLVASRVQKMLLPKRVPTIHGLQSDIFNIPSQIIGGDLYDVFKIDEYRQGFAIGDVSGKGAPAAILMAVAYAGFRSLLKEIDPVVTVVARLNNFLAEVTTPAYYATFVYGILDLRQCLLTYCNAGHNPPILLRKDLSVTFLDKGGIVLGFLENQQYQQTTIPLQSGDYICLYTDGVTEIKNRDNKEFEEKRLIRLLKKNYGLPPREMRKKIISAVQRFSGKKEFQDDLTLLIFYVE